MEYLAKFCIYFSFSIWVVRLNNNLSKLLKP